MKDEIFYFDEGENVKDISLDTLRDSLTLWGPRSKPQRSRPIESWELIEQIVEMCAKAELTVSVEHIYIPQNGAKTAIERDEKELYKDGNNIPIKKWYFERVAAMIRLHHKDDGELTTALVMSFHDKGIQIAWGTHVSLCSNMCIFGGNTMYTFGEKKMPFEKMMVVLESWILDFESKRAQDLEIIEKMKNTQMDISHMDKILDLMVGSLYRSAVRGAYVKGETASVFSITQCSVLVQNIEEKMSDIAIGEEITLWDVYNWGTEILKPGNTEIMYIYDTVLYWGEFLADFVTINDWMVGTPNGAGRDIIHVKAEEAIVVDEGDVEPEPEKKINRPRIVNKNVEEEGEDY